MKIRKSKQRDRILELLKSTGKHPTATWIYDKLKDEFQSLSLGTVYRNLNILLEQGQIRKIDFGSTFDRYEANINEHYHFICENCNSIIDLNIPVRNDINDLVSLDTNLKIRTHRIEFFGLCDSCRA